MNKNIIVRRTIGIVGFLSLSIALFGMWQLMNKSVDTIDNAKDFSEIPAVGVENYYPLSVGNSWIYLVEDSIGGNFHEVRRHIVRHERRDHRDVYHFEDGSLAYRQDGKVYEINPEGQLDVVFSSRSGIGDSYVYKSQGFHIEKRVSAVDTLIFAGDRNYKRCLEVITSFRRSSGSGVDAYASYYAPGIGLVGSRPMLKESSSSGTVKFLKDFSLQSM